MACRKVLTSEFGDMDVSFSLPPKLFMKNMIITLNLPLFLSESSFMPGMTGIKKNLCCHALKFLLLTAGSESQVLHAT